ncbi:MAG: LptE family protein [Chitinivibrionales bacterium]|nr:LptE family protein [Chitinivibrionales bacterium]
MRQKNSFNSFIAGCFVVVILLYAHCGVYTFSGSTLPGHLKTVDIPLFVNQTLQPGIAEYLTERLNRSILENRLLKVVPHSGDASIQGTVVQYQNQPYTYTHDSKRDVDIASYAVTIMVDVKFIDNKKNTTLYEGRISEEGVYNFTTEKEEKGREAATNRIISQIMQNSVQQW